MVSINWEAAVVILIFKLVMGMERNNMVLLRVWEALSQFQVVMRLKDQVET